MCINQTELQNSWRKNKIRNKFIMKVKDFDISLWTTDRKTTQKISKDIGRIQKHYQTTEPSWHLYNIPPYNSRMHIPCKHSQKSYQDRPYPKPLKNPNKFKRINIIQTVFSDHNKIKLEINNRKVTGKFPNTWKLKNTCLNNPWIKEERNLFVNAYN